MLAHYANTGMESWRRFFHASIAVWIMVLQTNPDFNQSLLEFIYIPKRHLVDTQLHVIDQLLCATDLDK